MSAQPATDTQPAATQPETTAAASVEADTNKMAEKAKDFGKQATNWFTGLFSSEKKTQDPSSVGGTRRRNKKSRINFSKIKWGSFTKKYNSYIKRNPRKKTNLPDLKHFAQYVNKHPKQFNKKTHKRALFYKNVILRKRK